MHGHEALQTQGLPGEWRQRPSFCGPRGGAWEEPGGKGARKESGRVGEVGECIRRERRGGRRVRARKDGRLEEVSEEGE